MHVLILPSWYFPYGSQEIAGRMFHQLAFCLREKGVDARVLYSDYTTKAPIFRKERHGLEETVPTWRFSQFYLPKRNKLLIAWWIKKCVSDISGYIEKEGRPDLIHAHSYFAAAIGTEVQKTIGIPFVYTERLSAFMMNKIPNLHKDIVIDVLERASLLTGVSPGMVQSMKAYTERPVEVVPNFFDERIFHIKSETKKYDQFTWVSVGEPAYIKGLDILFHAFAALKKSMPEKQMQLILIDRISEKEELIQLAKSLDINNDIIWKGLIQQNEIAEILRKSHLLVSASRVETFGKSIIEALACGLPVVATKTNGAKYIITSDELGELADIDHAKALMLAMQKAMIKYNAYHPQQIANSTKERFGVEVIIPQWISLYKSLLV